MREDRTATTPVCVKQFRSRSQLDRLPTCILTSHCRSLVPYHRQRYSSPSCGDPGHGQQPSQTIFFGVLEQLFSVIEGSAKRHSWFMEYKSAADLHPKPLKGLSDPRWNCQGRTVEVVRSRLQGVNETLQRIRDKSAYRKVTGEAVGLLACTSKFEFAIALVFFSKLLSPLDTLTIYIVYSHLYSIVYCAYAIRCVHILYFIYLLNLFLFHLTFSFLESACLLTADSRRDRNDGLHGATTVSE